MSWTPAIVDAGARLAGFGSQPIVWVAPFARPAGRGRRQGIGARRPPASGSRRASGPRSRASARRSSTSTTSRTMPTPVEDALGRFTRGAGHGRPHPDRRLGQHGPARTPFFVAIEALGGRVVRRGVPAHPGSMLWLARDRPDGDPRPADLRRVLEGDGRGPAAAAPAVRRAGLGEDGRQAGPRRHPDPVPAVPVPALRPRAGRARRLTRRGTPARDLPCTLRDMTAPPDRENRPAGTRSIEALTEDFRGRDYIADRSLVTAVFLALELGRPLLLEGEAGVGKTELAKVLAASPRRAPDPAPVLRGPGRQHRRLRVELPAPDARDPAARGPRRGRPGDRPRHLRLRLPHPPAAPPGARGPRRRRPGPAHRRDRPRRRGVRGVPARDPVRLPGHRPRDRHDQGRAAAARDPDLQPDARGPRRAQAPLPVPLDRLPDGPEGVRDRARARARRRRSSSPARSSASSIGCARPT